MPDNPISPTQMAATAAECQKLARELANHQSADFTLNPRMTTRIVNALLNAGNTFEFLVRQSQPATPTESVSCPANSTPATT